MKHKSKLPPFVAVRRDLLKNPEWRKLSSSAKVLYIYMRSKFNYKTLSEVSMSYSEMKDMLAAPTLSRAFKELMTSNFIEKTKQGGLMGGVCSYKFKGEFKEFIFRGRKV